MKIEIMPQLYFLDVHIHGYITIQGYKDFSQNTRTDQFLTFHSGVGADNTRIS